MESAKPTTLTLAEAAPRFRVHRDTLRRKCKSGLIPHSRIGTMYRIPLEYVERFEAGTSPVTTPAEVATNG